jgi:energy-coupling factor transport system permease protein
MLAHFAYVPRDSPIHRLDPAAKVIFMLCYIFSMGLFYDVRVLAILLAIGLGYYALARLRWAETRRAWTFVLVFVFVLVGISTLVWGAGRRWPNPT